MFIPAAIDAPDTDPTPIFELFRGNYATELLTAAVAHLGVFRHFLAGPITEADLHSRLRLEDRPATVLLTALKAFGLIVEAGCSRLDASTLARKYLLPGAAFSVSDYIGLAADSPGVLAMVERLRTNRPASAKPDEGAAFIYREGIDSAMEQEAAARRLTLALAGRARNVAPAVAANLPLDDARILLDVGGGTGIYAIACLQKNPKLRAIVWDRPEVLKVAAEMAASYGVADRVTCQPGDMFADPVPAADVVLLSNVLHDWDVPQCRALLSRCAAVLPAEGRLVIHDVFLNDALDGPLPIALYSAALFALTEGRAYSAAEYRDWLREARVTPGEVVPTRIHCGLLSGVRG